ncbi:MAG: hypothetical protein WBE90_20635 [Xanthobacteraceae bacterium]
MPAERYANTREKSVQNRCNLFTERSGVFHRAAIEDLKAHQEAAAMQPYPDPSERLIMVPFDARESITLEGAAKLCRKSTETIRSWAQRHGIGRKIGGAWHISRVALQMLLDGDLAALAVYHAGNRTDPAVRSYFERVGCAALLQKFSEPDKRASYAQPRSAKTQSSLFGPVSLDRSDAVADTVADSATTRGL